MFQDKWNASQKTVQSQLRRRLGKAASELGLHYFLWHLANAQSFTNIVDLFYSLHSKSFSKLLNFKVSQFSSENVLSYVSILKFHQITKVLLEFHPSVKQVRSQYKRRDTMSQTVW